MTRKHDLYGTGFAGGEVAGPRGRSRSRPGRRLISVTAELLESLDGAMITGCAV